MEHVIYMHSGCVVLGVLVCLFVCLFVGLFASCCSNFFCFTVDVCTIVRALPLCDYSSFFV